MAASMSNCFYAVSRHLGRHSISRKSVKTYLPTTNGYSRSCRCLSSLTPEPADTRSLAEAFKEASAKQASPSKRTLFRTSENNPELHTNIHEGLYYTVNPEDMENYFSVGLHKKFYKMCQAFNEACVMVREPAAEIFQCLRAAEMSFPIIRYVIYGRYGTGKSVTLSHVMHHCGSQGWVIVHVPWVHRFAKKAEEIQASSYKPDRVDTPLDCAEWLGYFQKINGPIISKLKTVGGYQWSKRESVEPGTPLMALIEFAFSRPKYGSDVMGVILKELKLQSSQGVIKTLVAFDGANALWQTTKLKRIDTKGVKYEPDEVTVLWNLKKMLQNNWSGGAAVITVDEMSGPEEQRQSYMPRFLLNKEALDVLEPHIPIHVQKYNDKEAHSCLAYLSDRKWIQKPEGLTEAGRREILFLSSQNPLEMYNVTARW